jgi:hypothetical protein
VGELGAAAHRAPSRPPSLQDVSAKDPLRGPRLKLERADRHLAELDERVEAYYETGPITLDGRYDSASSRWIVSVHLSAEPPAEIGTIVGDAAHNLRSSLDQMTWRLALLTTNTPYKRTQFPIFTDEDSYGKDGYRMLQDLRSEHAEFIKALQPFNESEPTQTTLHTLNRLSNVDKHRQLHLANTALLGASLRISDFEGAAIGGIGLAFGVFTDGSDVAAIQVYPDGSGNDPRMQVEMDGAFDLGVVDDDGTELSVYAGLYAAREYVGDLMDWFEPVF